ncbi:OmpA/MotB domain protein [Mucilaginibacter paludis DSM 18603]|uniref:OmpA/MotB domain protein n=2 Tax=Mucilaginibacter TaxID=423349 RepID=H1Y2K0_9SPHI|nr:OmpA/MotB domain protein [Mucilaginibacter paludis DSM 18603]
MHSCQVMSTKKYKGLLATQDSLTNRAINLEGLLSVLKLDSARMHREIADLKSNLSSLNDRYNALDEKYNGLNSRYTASSSKVSQLSTDLQKREARLKEVEDILRKRDEATNALKEKLQKALLGFQQSGLTVDIRNGKVYVSLADKLLFPSGSIVIDEKGKSALKQLAAVLNKEPDIYIAVEGHTDDKKVINLGQIKDNWDLSVLRATSVTRYLTETEKVDPVRLTATGKGQFQPIDPAGTPEARAKNRRIEIVLSPRLDELYNLISK